MVYKWKIVVRLLLQFINSICSSAIFWRYILVWSFVIQSISFFCLIFPVVGHCFSSFRYYLLSILVYPSPFCLHLFNWIWCTLFVSALCSFSAYMYHYYVDEIPGKRRAHKSIDVRALHLFLCSFLEISWMKNAYRVWHLCKYYFPLYGISRVYDVEINIKVMDASTIEKCLLCMAQIQYHLDDVSTNSADYEVRD